MWAGLARFAEKMGLTASGRSVEFRSVMKAGAHGPAQNTAPKLKPHGESILTRDRLRARALKQNNRNAAQVEAYIQRHKTLIRGACFDN